MKETESHTMFVDFQHLLDYDGNVAELCAEEYFRLEPQLRKAVYDVMVKLEPEWAQIDGVPRDFYVAFYGLKAPKRCVAKGSFCFWQHRPCITDLLAASANYTWPTSAALCPLRGL